MQNININGYKALLYCFGLSSSRYIEYATALDYLKKEPREKILDIGSGHSIFPSILKNEGFDVFVVDNARESLVWQKKKTKSPGSKRHLKVALSSGERLPFDDSTFSSVTAISVIEHVPDDRGVAREIGRVLKSHGTCIVSVPATPLTETLTNTHWTYGVPTFPRMWLRPTLGVVFKRFNVDRRDKDYLIREYCTRDVLKRIVEPSGCALEEISPFENVTAKMIYSNIVPSGVLTPLELLLVAKFTNIGESIKNVGGVIIKMRKP